MISHHYRRVPIRNGDYFQGMKTFEFKSAELRVVKGEPDREHL